MTKAWSDAQLAVLAKEVGCTKIETDKAGVFAVIWSLVLIFCLATAIGLTIVYRYFFVWKDANKAADLLPVKPPKAQHRRGRHHKVAPQPDMEAAKKHLKDSSPVDTAGEYRGIWKTPLRDLVQVGGPGLELYFRMLVLLGLVFSYLTLCSVPLLVFSMLGRFASSSSDLPQTSVANLGAPAVAGVAQENRLVVVGCQAVTLANVTDAFGWFDFLGTCILTIFTIWFRFRKVPKKAREADKEQVTCSDFTLEVDVLPSITDTANVARQLQQHLDERLQVARSKEMADPHDTKESKVREVVLVFDRGMELDVVKKRAELKLKREIIESKGEETTKIDEKIKKLVTK